MNSSIFNFHSPIEWREEEDQISIKGFASVNQMDREREIVKDPREFNIPGFMTSPTLMVNHEFLRDQYGNRRSAGTVTKAVAVSVKAVLDDEVIVEGLDEDFTDSICRSCAPDLSVGDLGLFIYADVHHEIAKEMVTSGEVGGLSWRGITRRRERSMCEGLQCVALKEIDLMEVSLVHNQCQPQSTFMIAKSVDGKVSLTEADLSSLSTYAYRFPKANFPTLDRVEAYLGEHSLASKSVSETDESFVAWLATPSAMETEKSVSIQIGGVELISAPDKNQDTLIGTHVGTLTTNPVTETNPMASQKNLRVFLIDEEGLAERFPGLTTQTMKSVATAEGEAMEICTMEFPCDETVEASPEATSEETETEAEASEEVVAEDVTVVEDAVEATSEAADDASQPNGDDEDLQAQIADLREQLNALTASNTPDSEEVTEEMETPAVDAEVAVDAEATTEADVPVEDAEAVTETEPVSEDTAEMSAKMADQVSAQLQTLTETLKSVQSENEKLRETTVALQTRLDSQTPSHDPREEDFISAKSADEVSAKQRLGGFAGRTFFDSVR